MPVQIASILAYDLAIDCWSDQLPTGSFEGVRFVGVGLEGVALRGQTWEVSVNLVDPRVDFWNGSYPPAENVPGPACLSAVEMQRRLLGVELQYVTFDGACAGRPMPYTTTTRDGVVVGDEAIYIDRNVFPPVVHRTPGVQLLHPATRSSIV